MVFSQFLGMLGADKEKLKEQIYRLNILMAALLQRQGKSDPEFPEQ
jgi:hypothetical protein